MNENSQHSDLEVLSLKKAFIFQQDDTLILSDVNLSVCQGEFSYLIGKTGSGKSTLLKTLYGELPLKEGEGMIAGFDLRQINSSDIPFLRRKLGIIFQDFQLLSDRNIFKNLQFVLKATGWKDKQKMKKRIVELIERVGLGGKEQMMPHELSGGEQQRVVVARALLNSPEIILADEPTGNLDPQVTDDIMSLLHQIADNGTAVLMATHDYRIINKFPGKIFNCEAGIIEEVSFIV